MTDNEIIKGLEHCYTVGMNCKDCPLFNVDGCNDTLMGCAKDLINRQNAEIERLKKTLRKLSEIGYCHNFQLERSDLVSWIYEVCDVIKVAKEMTEGGQCQDT